MVIRIFTYCIAFIAMPLNLKLYQIYVIILLAYPNIYKQIIVICKVSVIGEVIKLNFSATYCFQLNNPIGTIKYFYIKDS